MGMVYGGEEGEERREGGDERRESGGGSRWVEYTGARKGWWKRVREPEPPLACIDGYVRVCIDGCARASILSVARVLSF